MYVPYIVYQISLEFDQKLQIDHTHVYLTTPSKVTQLEFNRDEKIRVMCLGYYMCVVKMSGETISRFGACIMYRQTEETAVVVYSALHAFT